MTHEPSCAIRGASSRRWGVQAIVWTRAPGTSTQSGPPPNTSFSITVTPVLLELALRNLKVGLISNSHRCLVSFQQHFELQGLIAGAVSGSDHGYVKPHPSIFQAALRLLGVEAAESLMVGDSTSARYRRGQAGGYARRARAAISGAERLRQRRSRDPRARSVAGAPVIARQAGQEEP